MALTTGEVTAIIIGIGNFTAWAKLFTDARKNNKHENGKVCPIPAVESRIATVESEKAGLAIELSNLHTENRQDHQKIFEDIKSLSVAVANKGKRGGRAQ